MVMILSNLAVCFLGLLWYHWSHFGRFLDSDACNETAPNDDEIDAEIALIVSFKEVDDKQDDD